MGRKSVSREAEGFTPVSRRNTLNSGSAIPLPNSRKSYGARKSGFSEEKNMLGNANGLTMTPANGTRLGKRT